MIDGLAVIDAHMHVESTLLTPPELAKLLVPHGTAAVVADPHEVGNVFGVRGITALVDCGRFGVATVERNPQSCPWCTKAVLRRSDGRLTLSSPLAASRNAISS